MSITFRCGSCGKALRVKDELAGRRGRCSCGAVVAVPATPPAVGEEAAATDPEDWEGLLAAAAALTQDAPAVDPPAQPSFLRVATIPPSRPVARPSARNRVTSKLWPAVLALILRLKFVLGATLIFGILYLVLPGAAMILMVAGGFLVGVGGAIATFILILTAPEPVFWLNPFANMAYIIRRWDRMGNAAGALIMGIALVLSGITLLSSALTEIAEAHDQHLAATPSRPLIEPRPPANVSPSLSPRLPSAAASSNTHAAPSAAVTTGGITTRIQLMMPPGTHAPRSVPVILMAPAGSNLLTGMDLTEDDLAEFQPFVDAGFAVIAYSLSGPLTDDDPASIARAVREFMQADGGLANFQQAMQHINAHPQLDPDRIFTAGHSSAGLVALLAAAKIPGIKGTVAFAPAVDIPAFLRASGLPLSALERELPGVTNFAMSHSPAHLPRPTCPVFIFRADDDPVIPLNDLRRYTADVARHTFARTPTGGHHQAMLDVGMDKAIHWLTQACDARPVPRTN